MKNFLKALYIMGFIGFGITHTEPVHSDIATNLYTGGEFHTFWVERGDDLVSRRCPRQSLLRDRATCNEAKVRVHLAKFEEILASRFGRELPSIDRRMEETYTRVAQIDTRLLEFINTDPSPDRPDLLDEISRVQVDTSMSTPSKCLIELIEE